MLNFGNIHFEQGHAERESCPKTGFRASPEPLRGKAPHESSSLDLLFPLDDRLQEREGKKEESMPRITFRILTCKAAAVVSSILMASMVFASPAGAAPAAGENLAQIVAGARKEGTLLLSSPSSLTPRGAQALIDGVNKKWGLHLRVNYAPARSYPAIAAQIITESKTGQPPSYDAVNISADSMVELHKAGLLLKPKWTRIFPFISKEAVRLQGGALTFATEPLAPAYNTRMLKPADLPKSWEDLGDSRWKGKMLVPSYANVWAYLSQALGEKKVTQLVREIAANSPIFGTYGQIQTRLGAGEYPLAAFFHFAGLTHMQSRGAPVKFIDVAPFVVNIDMSAVVKGALHPNAAILFSAFCLTREGQEIWFKYGARSSALVSGTPQWKFLQGKKYVIANPEWYEQYGIPLEKKYAGMLGLTK